MAVAPALVLPRSAIPVRPRRQDSASRHVRTFIADGLWLLAIVACVPVAILAIGMPVVIVVRLLLWLAKVL
jgi:hypothetical protein